MSAKAPPVLVQCPAAPEIWIDAEGCENCNDEVRDAGDCHGCCCEVIAGHAPFKCSDCGGPCRDGLNVPREVAL